MSSHTLECPPCRVMTASTCHMDIVGRQTLDKRHSCRCNTPAHTRGVRNPVPFRRHARTSTPAPRMPAPCAPPRTHRSERCGQDMVCTGPRGNAIRTCGYRIPTPSNTPLRTSMPGRHNVVGSDGRRSSMVLLARCGDTVGMARDGTGARTCVHIRGHDRTCRHTSGVLSMGRRADQSPARVAVKTR